MIRLLASLSIPAALCGLTLLPTAFAQQAPVRIEPPQLEGSRSVEPTTQTAVLRDYLQAWNGVEEALDANSDAPLDPEFVGTAHDKLADTVAAQIKAGVHTRYQALSHDLQFVFYSPEGQSIELLDTVEYEQQVFADKKSFEPQRIRQRFLVVLTPAEARWRVRVLQAGPVK